MIFNARSVEIKSPDWKIVTAVDPNGIEVVDASINRKDKSGNEFPGFDAIIEGASFEAETWRNPAGKWYFFAPKKPASPRGSGAITKAMETKRENIKEAQDAKTWAIRVSGAMRDATLMVSTFDSSMPFPTNEELKKDWENWRDYFLSEFDKKINQPF